MSTSGTRTPKQTRIRLEASRHSQRREPALSRACSRCGTTGASTNPSSRTRIEDLRTGSSHVPRDPSSTGGFGGPETPPSLGDYMRGGPGQPSRGELGRGRTPSIDHARAIRGLIWGSRRSAQPQDERHPRRLEFRRRRDPALEELLQRSRPPNGTLLRQEPRERPGRRARHHLHRVGYGRDARRQASP